MVLKVRRGLARCRATVHTAVKNQVECAIAAPDSPPVCTTGVWKEELARMNMATREFVTVAELAVKKSEEYPRFYYPLTRELPPLQSRPHAICSRAELPVLARADHLGVKTETVCTISMKAVRVQLRGVWVVSAILVELAVSFFFLFSWKEE